MSNEADNNKASPEAQEAAPANARLDELIDHINREHFVVVEAGKTVIFRPATDPALGRLAHWRMSFSDFQNAYSNRTVSVKQPDGSYSEAPLAPLWLKSPRRRQYLGGVVFDPSGSRVPPNGYNLWRGFAVQPKQGEWPLMQRHLEEVICGGNAAESRYLFGWLARMFQYPGEQGEVAVVLRGLRGGGKGTLAQWILRIFGEHGLHMIQAAHLTGNFNAHLQDTCFLYADEAFFAGDPRIVGILNGLITERAILIEGKRRNAVMVKNCLHVLMASNNDWVVPAACDERRYFLPSVSDHRRGDFEYFDALEKEAKEGGLAAMLHEALAYDLHSFNVRRIPDTPGLNRQKLESLNVVDRWWLDVLQRGYVFDSRLGLSGEFRRWADTVTMDFLFLSYSGFAKGCHERHPLTRERLGQFMAGVKAKAIRPRAALPVGEEMREEEAGGGDYGIGKRSQRVAKPITRTRAHAYSLGTLAAARAAFAEARGLVIEWAEEPGEEAEAEAEDMGKPASQKAIEDMAVAYPHTSQAVN